MTAFSSFVKKL